VAIKIVTDSTSDIPQPLAEELGITVVPLYTRFGEKVYRDRIDISEEEFFQRLLSDPIHPTTSQPSPQDFVSVYEKLSGEADGIISIHISGKLSGTCNSALRGKEIVGPKCPIEVIDSEMVSMGFGLIVLRAVAIAASGKSFTEVVDEVKKLIPKVHLWALFDTLKYLAKGGRIGKAKAFLGSVLNIKPILGVKDGEMIPVVQARSREKGIELLYKFVNDRNNIRDLAVMYTTSPKEAKALADRLGTIYKRSKIIVARLGPALGVHAGPGALAVALLER
jgi:DegV family protein with EDD domain